MKLPASEYASRRASVLEQLAPGEAMLLPTQREVLRSGDSHFPFRPHSDFWYLTGFPEPDAWALLKKGAEGDGFTLFVRPKDPERETWTGVRAGVQGAVEQFGADRAFPLADLEVELGRLLADVEVLHFAFGRHGKAEPKLQRVLTSLRRGRKAGLGPHSIVDPGRILEPMRLHKSPAELSLMRRGAAITGEAHVEAMRSVRPGMGEWEIQALIEGRFRKEGAWGWAYPSIVGGGANACILHYIENHAVFGADDLMLIDAGAEVDGYATDVTRTSPVSGRFSPAQRDLYDLVLSVEQWAVDAVRPGATLGGIHEGVVERLVDGLLELGVLSGDRDEVIEQQAYKRVYMHRTSHWLGLDVHDVGRYVQPDGEETPLAPGMVVTIEPGVYVAPGDEQSPERYRGIGIRVEDDVLVTESGRENLTAHIPKAADDIEALRA